MGRLIEKIKPYRRICSRFEKLEESLLIGTYPPNPRYSLRFVVGYACACEEGGTVSGFARGTYPPNPPSCEEGGNADGFYEGMVRGIFNRFMPSVNAIRATRAGSHQRSFTPLSS